MDAKVLIYDIENMALRGWAWGIYEQNILHIDHDQHTLSIAYKWLGEKKVHCISLPDYKGYRKDPHSDKQLAEEFWNVVNEADILVGHNIKSFDNKMINAMFMRHDMPPPSPYRSVDTKTEMKKVSRFPSNKLDDLGGQLGIGHKKQHDGFSLWIGCDEGDKKAWKKMVAYNKQDVSLTEQLYLKLRPWITGHPPLNVYLGRPEACPKCGLSGTMSAGMKYKATNGNRYQYYRCKECGGMAKSRYPEEQYQKMQYVN